MNLVLPCFRTVSTAPRSSRRTTALTRIVGMVSLVLTPSA
ncbi:hypothetical protein L829_4137 [Mycobacteroides abscessus MAB_030201_1075]|uniref:Uncharacterized protein n=1 Tax=Mycobacteroides abscessus MAB_030201_1075 TaxID=1335410 RepID=A0A829PTY3_9MYCO|nr:hypothetical protein L835_4848 [Mycobacteroides abscessus MAB_110811_1470]ETZ74135.1 hypothetical protein L835_1217 [Mycobacteroides abscessus MAB_110811_1470]ETZ90552.1 hypothetical protein L829_4137 [Mycobacteroides abscessus MAB_030201_1075]ETZ93122.1 hypothetical protein L828_1255 [Mycobacteroides abscessus MAB_030201_1061]